MRRKDNVKQTYNGLKTEIATMKKDLEKVKKREEINKKKYKQVKIHQEKYMKDIKNSEEEYAQSKMEIDGVLSIMSILMQDIDNSIFEVKNEIHDASITSFNLSITDFKSLIQDLIDFIEGLKNISDGTPKEIAEQLKSMMEMVDLLTSGIGDAINLMVNNIKEVNQVAVNESTGKFDDMIRDFVEIFENISVLLNRLTQSRASELREELMKINLDLNESIMISTKNNNEIATLSSEMKYKTHK